MLPALGSAGMLVALLGGVLLTVRGIAAARSDRKPNVAGAAQQLVAGAVVAMGTLVLALVTDDFSLVYTANHHARATPFPFDIATAWASS